MKKIILGMAAVLAASAMLSSCGSSEKAAEAKAAISMYKGV